MTQQWLRACSLVISSDQSESSIELAGPDLNNSLRIRFTTTFQFTTTPASLKARIYNLSPQTVSKILALAGQNGPGVGAVPIASRAQVVLKAGYQGKIGLVFTGQIYQMRIGKERNTDSYLDIFAADGDFAHNWSICAFSVDKGYTQQDLWKKATGTMTAWGVQPSAPPSGLPTTPSPRGKVVMSMTREALNDLGDTNNFTWNIVNNQVVGVPKYTWLDTEAIEINSSSGMIGVPEQTEVGVSVSTLLNADIRWGTLIHLNASDIARFVQGTGTATAQQAALSPNISQATRGGFLPPFNADGYYVVLQATHVGDTRGNEWYTHMVCLSVDKSAQVPLAVPQEALPPPLA
jgi:hypothetical protein